MGSMLGPICAFTSSVTWAIGSAQYSKYSNTYSAFRVNFNRALLTLPFFVITVFLMAGSVKGGLEAYSALRPEHFAWFLLSVVSSYALGDAFFLWSTLSLGVPGALAIASCYPILNALFAVFFEGTDLNLHQWGGLVLSIFGIIIVVLNQPKHHLKITNADAAQKAKSKTLGILFATLTAFAWSLNSISVAKAARDLDAGVGNTVRMAFAIILCMVFGRLIGKETMRPLPTKALNSLGLIIILESFVGCYFFVYGLSHSDLVLASILTSLAPVISVPVSVILKLEAFSWKRTAGVIAVVLGLVFLTGAI